MVLILETIPYLKALRMRQDESGPLVGKNIAKVIMCASGQMESL